MSDMSDFTPDEELLVDDDAPFDADAAAALPTAGKSVAPIELAPEPLFSLLFQRAVDLDDAVLQDYARHVVPHVSRLLGHVAAKGGKFVQDKLSEGKTAAQVAHFGDDQTMRAHLINGILPVARIARTLKAWGIRRFELEFDQATYRLFCAGYTLHDWLKLPHVDEQLLARGLRHHTVNPAVHLPTVEAIIRDWCMQLGLETFLAPVGSLDACLHDLIYIASNTQLLWGVMHNLSMLPGMRHRGRGTLLATELCTLADYLAYLGRTPIDAVAHPSIQKSIASLNPAGTGITLTYHHLSDLRGVLTNIIHNAAVDAFADPQYRIPLLYAPTGVVYLEHPEAPPTPMVETVADAVVARIQAQARAQLERDLTGFGRSGHGLKYADYYDLFFSPAQLAGLIARYTEKRMMNKSDAQKRYDAMQAKNMTSLELDSSWPVVAEVDRLAEVSAQLVKLAANTAPQVDAEGMILEWLGAQELREEVHQVNANRTAGGVPYGWYLAAGWYRKRTPGRDPQQWNTFIRAIATDLSKQLPDQPRAATGWQDIRQYVIDHLRFYETNPANLHQRMASELTRYAGNRKSGNGSTRTCSLCSSPYAIQKQQEAAILFAPMVYTNKQPLHGSNAIRNICTVCSMEMMLRQLLMKRGRESGGNFEKRKVRYLFFYPTYFFTPETLKMLRTMQDQLRRASFTTMRNLLQPDLETARYTMEPQVFQRLHPLMLNPALVDDAEEDRLLRMRFPANEAITFSFIGIPPADRDAKDAEAWIHPAFLALVLPLLLDVKVVASESMLPTMQEATELPETVAFDSAHAFVGYLTEPSRRQPRASTVRQTPGRFNIDELLPALQRLTAAYFIHMDGNAKSGAGGYDYRWHEIGPLARNLATSPLYAFHYLKKSLRREGKDVPSGYKSTLYVGLVDDMLAKGADAMSHARELVTRYRRFYRHGGKRLNSNAILRPIREAADTLLEANLRLFDDDQALREVVSGRLRKSMQAMSRPGASGGVPVWLYPDLETRNQQLDEAIDAFSAYFVDTIFRQVFVGNRAALAGKQLNLLKNACEALYIAEQRREWKERNEPIQDSDGDEVED